MYLNQPDNTDNHCYLMFKADNNGCGGCFGNSISISKNWILSYVDRGIKEVKETIIGHIK